MFISLIFFKKLLSSKVLIYFRRDIQSKVSSKRLFSYLRNLTLLFDYVKEYRIKISLYLHNSHHPIFTHFWMIRSKTLIKILTKNIEILNF